MTDIDMAETDTTAERRLPVGVQSFEKMRQGGYLYVDKTAYIWRLIQEGTVYFLSRPRRFGKSLLTSTLEAYFQGRKDLFQGLAIESLEDARGDDAWTCYPVVHFDLSTGNFTDPDALGTLLGRTIADAARRFGVPDEATLPLGMRLAYLIQRTRERTGRRVVVLVDEYDKPVLDVLGVDSELEEKNRRTFKGTFSALKSQDVNLKFAFVTGITRFSHMSIFSDLNQLRDISLSDGYAAICGITQDEMTRTFQPEIDTLAATQGMTRDECLEELAQMYDGYHFTKQAEGVYNPFSLFRAFQEQDFGTYWFESGTPTALVNLLLNSGRAVADFDNGIRATPSMLGNLDNGLGGVSTIPLFYQSGYLTIRGYDRTRRLYTLGYPNREVKYGFLEELVPTVLGVRAEEHVTRVYDMAADLEKGDIDAFMMTLTALFASLSYNEGPKRPRESEFRNEVQLTFLLLGMDARCEVHSATGRADCFVLTEGFIYIFEFKVDQSADAALTQIDEKHYTAPYDADPRTLVRVGVNFSGETRTVTDWKVA